ncbi:hypothetical protein [Clostridium tyrobutyricum]|uniref:hypothetical protein n=1 Tax=Clostridium tyrobutyricum TaxID=1519 RepID=UPI00057C63F9|nr:hypothetical protein [Clostridium tyrobutyricum]
MDEIKKKKLVNGVVEKLKEKGNYHRAYDYVIEIYVDMQLHHEILKNRIENYKGSQEGKNILLDSLYSLEEDIRNYKKQLCL